MSVDECQWVNCRLKRDKSMKHFVVLEVSHSWQMWFDTWRQKWLNDYLCYLPNTWFFFLFCFFLTGRVFDPNKHCGVQDPETKRPCTRSLTCKVTQTQTRALSTHNDRVRTFFLPPVWGLWPGTQLCLFMGVIILKGGCTNIATVGIQPQLWSRLPPCPVSVMCLHFPFLF